MGAEMKVSRRTDRRDVLAIALVVAGMLVGIAGLRGQTQEPAKPASENVPAVQTNTVIQTESRVVLVDAVVTDKKGKYISGPDAGGLQGLRRQ